MAYPIGCHGLCGDGVRTAHERQQRVPAAPNILISNAVRPVRGEHRDIVRHRAIVDHQVSFAGLGGMELAGAIYHTGRTPPVGALLLRRARSG